MKRIDVLHVHYMPDQLQTGLLYVSHEFGTAQHLCACGCGSKIRTPLGPAEWNLKESRAGPTLWPSIGNWQRPCRSHYIIWEGVVHWAGDWTDQQVAAARSRDRRQLEAYFAQNGARQKGLWPRVKRWIGLD
ncbi:DUF6527 family protein [Hydrogenophaga sp.]|uniref:DUF6527 family protein n=1 Tax=Hydrogenophaga sp. TaxID=1904254 RepID=UPI00341F1430